jgi:hypothetical protein
MIDMPTKPKSADGYESLQIEALKRGRITLRLIGQTPFYFNAMSAKAKRDLLIGGGKKSAAEKAQIKHNPEQEFRDSVYQQATGETLLCFPAPGVKGAMATAALETNGLNKTTVNRLIFMPEQKIRVWGRPYLKMDVVRSADMNKTPDVRTRAFLPEWCAEVDIAFVTPRLSAHAIVSLLSNAGAIIGLGDFRQEKGRGSYGTFSVHGTDMGGEDAEAWAHITAQGRAVQESALADPECADDDTRELLALLRQERIKRAA